MGQPIRVHVICVLHLHALSLSLSLSVPGVSVCGVHQQSERSGHGLQSNQSAHPKWAQKDCNGGHGGKENK